MDSKKKIIGSSINIGSYGYFIDSLVELSKTKVSSYVCVANAHMLIEGFRSETFQDTINHANLATPDGMPLVKAIQLLYGINQERVAGMDLMPDLMKACEKQKLSIYLYGSIDKVLNEILKKSQIEFPDLNISGSYSPPFREQSEHEKIEIIRHINDTKSDFVFVALGCPKQEKWMAEHKDKIHSCMIGLGGAFEVYADVKGRAPKWMQDNSLEWLYRLMQDPKRLWKRYLVTNTLFIMLFLKQFVKIRIFKKND